MSVAIRLARGGELSTDGETLGTTRGVLEVVYVPFDALAAGTTSGDVLTWNGTAWESAAPSGGGGGLTFNEAAALAAFVGDFA